MTIPSTNGVNGHRIKAAGLDHMSLISRQALRRPQSSIRSLFPAEHIPGMISFLAGKPNSATFPLEEMTLKLKPDSEGGGSSLKIDGSELDTALQYGMTPGMPALLQWLTDWQSQMHHRKIVKANDQIEGGLNPWSIHVGQGSQDLLTKVRFTHKFPIVSGKHNFFVLTKYEHASLQTFHTLINEGDTCLMESPAYSGVLPELESLNAQMVPVPSDSEGMKSSSLRQILSSWSTSDSTKNLGFPKFVYTTPTGANPSGTTASEQRKREVLQVIREYGVLLLEDDPYMLLSFQGLDDGAPETRKRPRTYWDLEQEGAEEWGTGWVMRFDSFSKVSILDY